MEKKTKKKVQLSDLTKAQLLEIITLEETKIAESWWLDDTGISLPAKEQTESDDITARLLRDDPSLMNEATIWSRAIYPLLMLAERDKIRAWAEVSLSADFYDTILSGTADGAFATSVAGIIEIPYFVIVEGKRALENKNPRIQFYGQLLAAAHLNWEQDPKETTEIFGCYTIGTLWTISRATLQGMDTTKPHMAVEYSREYMQQLEAETILKILKKILGLQPAHLFTPTRLWPSYRRRCRHFRLS